MNTFLLPDLGEGLTEAEIVRWLVKVGDVVAVDTPIAEVETAKSIVELPSPYAGVIEELHGEPGTTVPVGKPLITVGDPAGAAYRAEERAGSGNVLVGYGTAEPSGPARRRKPRTTRPAVTEETVPQAALEGPPAHVPESGSDHVPGSAPERMSQNISERGPGSIPGRGAESVPERGSEGVSGSGSAARVPLVISPLVRRMARDAGVDLHELTGSGPDGLIVRRDVEHAIAFRTQPQPTHQLAGQQIGAQQVGAQPIGQQVRAQHTRGQQAGGQEIAAQAVTGQQVGARQVGGQQVQAQQTGGQEIAAQAAAAGQPGVEARTGLRELRREPMSGFRRAVAATLSRSRAEIPEATTWVDVDATALVELRASLRSATDPGPGLLALMARFVVAGLLKYPELNGYVDTAREELVQYDGVNLGLAAQTDRGLVVPAVGNAHTLTTRGLDAEIRRLTASARDGRLTQHELTSGTFTLNNYGSFGVDGSAAIINHPQVAILGVGRIIDRPWVVDGEIAVRKLTQLSLVFDHRVCDGGTAAAFLRFVADAFENPTSAFADL